MKIRFENNFQQKVMVQVFEEETLISDKAHIQAWRDLWTGDLKSWHSPYKVLIDCSKLRYQNSDSVAKDLGRMLKFFEGLFSRSVTGFGYNQTLGHDDLPFKVANTFEEAQELAGVRGLSKIQTPGDFRSAIQFQNHFAQHVVELSLAAPVVIDSSEKLGILKSKLTNNLMQWHSKWSLLIDCGNLQFSPELRGDWEKMERYFRSFFMKAVIGYSPDAKTRDHYPFETFRARHAAVAKLESEGLFMGNEAQCRSKTTGNTSN